MDELMPILLFTLVILVVAVIRGGGWFIFYVLLHLGLVGAMAEAIDPPSLFGGGPDPALWLFLFAVNSLVAMVVWAFVASVVESGEQDSDANQAGLTGRGRVVDQEGDGSEAKASNEHHESELPPKLVNIIASWKGEERYYVGSMIPENKRLTAEASYPPPGGTILALIDSTIWESAKSGLAVGREGISWKNTFEGSVSLSWHELAACEIRLASSRVKVGKNDFFAFDAKKAEENLTRLKEYAQLVTEGSDKIKVMGSEGSSENSLLPSTPKSASPTTGAFPSGSESANAVKRVLVNEADFNELLRLPGVGVAEAHMILKRREDKRFSSVVELVDFLDLKPHLATRLEALADCHTESAGESKDADTQEKTGTPSSGVTPGTRVID